jgi:virginiamycin B lyase
MKHDIFISYSSKESKYVDKVEKKLVEYGYKVWVDRSQLEAGQIWPNELKEAILNSRVLILVVSKHALDSIFVRQEYEYAISIKKDIIPLLIENITLPEGLNKIQWVLFSDKFQSGIDRLSQSLISMEVFPSGKKAVFTRAFFSKLSVVMALVIIVSTILGLSIDNYIQYTMAHGIITEFRINNNDSFPFGIVAGPDGNVWFTEYKNRTIAYINSSGEITVFKTLPDRGTPSRIIVGPNNSLWLTEMGTNKLLQIDFPHLEVTSFGLDGMPNAIISTHDGDICYSTTSPSEIETLSTGINHPAGLTFKIGKKDADDFVKDKGGNIWFISNDSNLVGEIKSENIIFPFTLPTNINPQGIAIDNSNIWITTDNNQILKIDQEGKIATYQVPTPDSWPTKIILGKNNTLWFLEQKGNKLANITLDGTIKEYKIPTVNSTPQDLTIDESGNIWFTEREGNNIGMLVP